MWNPDGRRTRIFIPCPRKSRKHGDFNTPWLIIVFHLRGPVLWLYLLVSVTSSTLYGFLGGKGEELPVDAPGVLLKDVLAGDSISDYSKVTVVANDSYSVEVSAEEIKEEAKVYLLLEEDSLRLQVFGDENSRRGVSDVVQIVVE